MKQQRRRYPRNSVWHLYWRFMKQRAWNLMMYSFTTFSQTRRYLILTPFLPFFLMYWFYVWSTWLSSWARIHSFHQVQLLALHRATKNQTICLRELSFRGTQPQGSPQRAIDHGSLTCCWRSLILHGEAVANILIEGACRLINTHDLSYHAIKCSVCRSLLQMPSGLQPSK